MGLFGSMYPKNCSQSALVLLYSGALSPEGAVPGLLVREHQFLASLGNARLYLIIALEGVYCEARERACLGSIGLPIHGVPRSLRLSSVMKRRGKRYRNPACPTPSPHRNRLPRLLSGQRGRPDPDRHLDVVQ